MHGQFILILEDTYKHIRLRKELVKLLAQKGIHTKSVLKAIEQVPRHLFFKDSIFDHKAYADIAFPIGNGQTISQPFTVAYQSQLLEVKSGDKILEIGTGSGYQAAILDTMGAKVYTVERQKKLYTCTKKLLSTMYPRVKTFLRDGFEGLDSFAPFDKILITCAAPSIPYTLAQQLKTRGKMIVPVNNPKEKNEQDMFKIEKTDDGTYKKEKLSSCAFVPMLKGIH